jgi:serine hydrolase
LKKAVILHGTDNNHEGNWFPWLKKELESRGYEVWVPDLPENHTPNRQLYNDFLFGKGWDFTDNLVIGHSSGAVSVLNLLADERCPEIATGVLVGSWSHTDDTDLDNDQFSNLFPAAGFDFNLIKKRARKLVFIHSNNDPYCPLEQAKWLAEQTKSEIIVIVKGQHFSTFIDPSYTKFPKLVEILEARQLL